jgi:branched-subunit amino acid aminotransferase/4-amino-4-deoxychorismate lyase
VVPPLPPDILWAYVDGRFLPDTEIRLSLHDAGFVFGATVTDFCRTFRHELFRVEDHVARFLQSCELARIPKPMSQQELIRLAKELTSRNSALVNKEEDLALVMFATPGVMGEDGPPRVGMYMFELHLERFAPWFRHGAHLVTPATRHVPTLTVDSRIKHRSRLHWWIADQEAQEMEKGAWALLLDFRGHVTETAVANFLVVKEGTVISPPRPSILGGISLLITEEICLDLRISVQERPLTVQDCLEADEALLTGTSFCLAGVSQLNGQPIPWPGKTFEKLLGAWNSRVGLDIRAQILSCG